MFHRLSLLLLLLCSAIVAPATLRVYDIKAWDIWRGPFGNVNGFVEVYCDNHHIGTTEVKENTRDPEWEMDVSYVNATSGNRLELRVYDMDVEYDHHLGTCGTTIKTGIYKKTCYLSTRGILQYRYFLL